MILEGRQAEMAADPGGAGMPLASCTDTSASSRRGHALCLAFDRWMHTIGPAKLGPSSKVYLDVDDGLVVDDNEDVVPRVLD